MEAKPNVSSSINEEKLDSSRGTSPHSAVRSEAPLADEHEYPSKGRLALIILALSLAFFLVTLDRSIVANANPKITDEFNSLNDIGWYGSGYLITICAVQFLFGRLFMFFSLKWVLLAAVGLFELGSLVCATAPSSSAFIVGRAIAGLGASGILVGSTIILAHSVPLHRRPALTGIIAATGGVAAFAGPLIGGGFTDSHLTWRWCFWINLPVGFVTAVILAFFYHPGKRNNVEVLSLREKIGQLDLFGLSIFVPSMVCLILALQYGGLKYAWSNWRLILLLVLFGVLFLGFIAIQVKKGERATLPTRIITQRSIAFGFLFNFCLQGVFLVLVYYLSIWFQAVKGVSAFESGIRTLPLLLCVVITVMLVGGLTTATGYYTPFMIMSAVLTSIGCGLLSTLTVTSSHPYWIGYQAIAGIGIGAGIQQSIYASQAVLSLEDYPVGSATMVFSQSLGSAIFVSVGENVLTNNLKAGLQKAIPNLPNAAEIVLGAGATNLRSVIERIEDGRFLNVVLQVYNEACLSTFRIAIGLAVASMIGALGMEWISIKKKEATNEESVLVGDVKERPAGADTVREKGKAME